MIPKGGDPNGWIIVVVTAICRFGNKTTPAATRQKPQCAGRIERPCQHMANKNILINALMINEVKDRECRSISLATLWLCYAQQAGA